MIELLVGGSLVAAVAAVSISRGMPQSAEAVLQLDPIRVDDPDRDGPDLPCPWCQAPTNETDEHCPSCRRKFG